MDQSFWLFPESFTTIINNNDCCERKKKAFLSGANTYRRKARS
jgi:hypothetical protein